MGYQIIPTFVFLLAFFAAILMVLRRLPEAGENKDSEEAFPKQHIHEKLSEKGLPAVQFSKIKHHIIFWAKKIWRFALEAKEMAPTGASVLKIKKLFASRLRHPTQSGLGPSEESALGEAVGKTEADYLDAIKKEPKNYAHYDSLGKFYLQSGQLKDGKDIYLYLTSHASGTADYWARLGFACFKLRDFKTAADAYSKATALDSSQPNRYYNLALALKALGQNDESEQALDKALNMDPQNSKFLDLKGRLEKVE